MGPLTAFAETLRTAGVRVSTAEVIDAARALDEVGVADRELVHGALAATLVKRAADRPTFDELFALFFERGLAAVDRAGEALGHPELANQVRWAAERIGLDAIESPLQIGMFTYRILDELGVGAAGEANGGALRRVVRAYVEDALRRNDAAPPAALLDDDRPIAQLSAAELAGLDAEVQRLARRLAARLPEPKPGARRGRLDVRATLRASHATGGVPFAVRRRRRPVRRPRLVILCDVSDSVRAVSRFFLALVHALHRRYDRVHTFVFVADLGDASRLFASRDVDRAIREVLGGAVTSVWQSSDYGKALGQLADRHLGKIGRRTTVLILGDGRSNHRPSRAAILADVRRRAHRVIWLDPEPPGAWHWGDSAMREYAPHCDRVLTVWNLRSLRAAVEAL